MPASKPVVSINAKGAWLGLALSLVGAWEGLYTHAYKDSVGVTTICYGVTKADRPVKMGDVYDVAQCKEMLATDLPRYDAMVQKCIHVPMTPHRHAAIVSFTYNVGGGALCKSSVARYLNAGNVKAGCDALLLYNRGGGRVIKGLDNRRHSEREWCLRSD